MGYVPAGATFPQLSLLGPFISFECLWKGSGGGREGWSGDVRVSSATWHGGRTRFLESEGGKRPHLPRLRRADPWFGA